MLLEDTELYYAQLPASRNDIFTHDYFTWKNLGANWLNERLGIPQTMSLGWVQVQRPHCFSLWGVHVLTRGHQHISVGFFVFFFNILVVVCSHRVEHVYLLGILVFSKSSLSRDWTTRQRPISGEVVCDLCVESEGSLKDREMSLWTDPSLWHCTL